MNLRHLSESFTFETEITQPTTMWNLNWKEKLTVELI